MPRPDLRAGIRGGGMHHPHPIGRIMLRPVLHPLQPAIPPAHGLLQEPHLRPRHRRMRVLMHPRPHDPLAGRRHILHQMRHRVHVIVGPAAPDQHRGLHPGIILAHRPVLPERPPLLQRSPARCQPRLGLKPLHPHPPPIRAQHRVRRARGIGQHHRPPAEILAQQAAALVMDVIRETVGGGTDRNHRLQRGRLVERGLQAVEPAP